MISRTTAWKKASSGIASVSSSHSRPLNLMPVAPSGGLDVHSCFVDGLFFCHRLIRIQVPVTQDVKRSFATKAGHGPQRLASPLKAVTEKNGRGRTTVAAKSLFASISDAQKQEQKEDRVRIWGPFPFFTSRGRSCFVPPRILLFLFWKHPQPKGMHVRT